MPSSCPNINTVYKQLVAMHKSGEPAASEATRWMVPGTPYDEWKARIYGDLRTVRNVSKYLNEILDSIAPFKKPRSSHVSALKRVITKIVNDAMEDGMEKEEAVQYLEKVITIVDDKFLSASSSTRSGTSASVSSASSYKTVAEYIADRRGWSGAGGSVPSPSSSTISGLTLRSI
jgi:cysteinyl-tRNA synthetase